MNLQYDVPVEVTRAQYRKLVKHFPEVIAHRRDLKTGKYYIKLWDMRYKEQVERMLSGYKANEFVISDRA